MAIVNSRAAIEPKTGKAAIFVNETIHSLMRKLFSNGEQGFFYDPNDLTTMWQDQAKLLPVTGAGQPVWHILDKSGNNNHAFATSSATRPILRQNTITKAYYLEFDGSDDFLVTNSIDFTATDKVGLFAGVRKLSDAAVGALVELGPNTLSNDGTFAVFTPGTATLTTFRAYSRGTITSSNNGATTNPAPNSFVGTAFMQISTDTNKTRIDGVDRSSVSTDQGVGNYGNHPLYIGRRAGTTFPFNGHLYSLIGIGRLTSDSETIALEKYIAKNTGVTLSV